MPVPKPEKRTRYNRKWPPKLKLQILNEAKEASGKYRNAVKDVCDKYAINTAYLAEWKKDLRKLGLWE